MSETHFDPWLENGGPAFPSSAGETAYPGMKLRDWFAGKALAVCLSDAGTDAIATALRTDFPEVIARASYALADAMLKERDRSWG